MVLSGGLDARGITTSPWPDTIDAPENPEMATPSASMGIDELAVPPAQWSVIVGLGVLLAAGGLWIRSLSDLDPLAMTELGLISVLPATFIVAVALLTAGFVILSSQPTPHGSLLTAYLVTFSAVANTTSFVVAGSLGNSWSWANVGVVEHVQRTGEFPETNGALSGPTEWPGVYTFTALLSDVSGLEPATLAMWMPLGFTLVALLALWVLFRAFTSDARIVWSAMWLYVLGTWVGQESLSPLTMSITLGLALLAVALPLDRFGGRDPMLVDNIGPTGTSVGSLGGAVAFVGLVGLAIVTSHPVTPVLLAATFAMAAATHTSRTMWLAIALGIGTAMWLAGPARTFVSDGALALLDRSGSPAQFATTTTSGWSDLTSGAQTVLVAGRFVALVLVLLAMVGLVSRTRQRRRVGFLVGVLLVPLLVVTIGVGSESLLRAFLFALAWVALAGAYALVRPSAARRTDLAVRLVVVGALTAGFLVAHSGERGAAYLTSAEVELAAWLSGSAPSETLLIEGTFNGPLGGQNIERFERVSLAEESPADLAADPEAFLYDRMTAARTSGFAAAFVVLTRSQRHGELIAPRLPDGLLGTIDAELRRSDRFMVVGENSDVVVFALTGRTS
jgi:hypothetical protein